MIISDDKRHVTGIVARIFGDGTTEITHAVPEEEIDPGDGALKSIAEDMLRALDKRSAHDLMTAMRAFISECMAQYDADAD